MTRWIFSTNAKDIGMLYLMFGLFSGMIGTAFSVLIRLELASPGAQALQGDIQLYNVIVTAHAFLMILFIVMFAKRVIFKKTVTLMQETVSISFCRLNNISFGLLPVSLILLLSSSLLEGGAGIGWTYYRLIIITITTILIGLGIFNLINLRFKFKKGNIKTVLTYIIILFLFVYATGINPAAIDKELNPIINCIIDMLMIMTAIIFVPMVYLLVELDSIKPVTFAAKLILFVMVILILGVTFLNYTDNIILLHGTDTDKITFTVSTTGTTVSNTANNVISTTGSVAGLYASVRGITTASTYMMANPKAPRLPGYLGMALSGSLGLASIIAANKRQSAVVSNKKVEIRPKPIVNDLIETKTKSVADCQNMDYIQCPLEEFEMNNGLFIYSFSSLEVCFAFFIFMTVLLILLSLSFYYKKCSDKLALKRKVLASSKTLMALGLWPLCIINFDLNLTEQEYYFLMLFSMRCFVGITIYASLCLIIVYYMSNYKLTIPVKLLDNFIKRIYNRFNNSKIVLDFIILLSQFILMYSLLIVMPSFIIN